MRALVFITCCLFLFSCGDSGERAVRSDEMPFAKLGDCEVVVVCPKKQWKTELEQSFDLVFESEFPGLFKRESSFDIISVDPSNFSSLLKKQAMIIEIEVSPKYELSKVLYKRDKYAVGQLYIKIVGPSANDVALHFLSMQDAILNKVGAFNDQFIESQLKYRTLQVKVFKGLASKVKVQNGFDIVSEGENYIYFGKRGKGLCQSGRNTTCSFQLGMLVHIEDYNGRQQLSEESFVQARNELTRKVILGPKKEDPTYMVVEPSFPIQGRDISWGGNYAKEYRGWWDMKGATMGGPFISFQRVSADGKKLYRLDAFVFAPNFSKRKFIKELEASLSQINTQLK